jgi:hypothetical protein
MKNFFIITIMLLFSNEVLSQNFDLSNSFNIQEIEVMNPDFKVLIDTILHMDSLCETSNVDYKISIKDTIIDDIRRYIITIFGFGNFNIDTVEIFGCFKYRNRSFFFEKPYVRGIGVVVTNNYYHFESQVLNIAIRDNIPQTTCVYFLGRLWILDRNWNLNSSCGDYEYPIEILSVIKN